MRLPWRWIVGGLVAMAAGVWMVALWLPAWLAPAPVERSPVEGEAPVAAPAQESRRITATLFYVAGTGDALVPVNREVPYAQSPALQARRIVEAQLGPAPSGRVTAVPDRKSVV